MSFDPHALLAIAWSGWTATWPTQLLAIIWIAWLVSWIVASLWSGRTQKQVMTWDSQAYRIPILAGGILFTPWTAQVLGEKPLWQFGNLGIYVLAARLVRHPIYTGLIAGMLATGIAVGTVTAMLGAVLISLGMWQKARMEEGFLTNELGAEAYGSYCRRVPMIVPFLPSR